MISNLTLTKESFRLLELLVQSQVRFVHWKSNCRLIESLEGKTDLDILVHPDSKVTFEECMAALGYKKLVSPPWSAYPEVEDWLAFDRETGRFLHLHIHFALVTGLKHIKHLNLPWLDKFFDNIQIDSETGWPIPIPEMETLILFIRVAAKMPPQERWNSEAIPDHILSELSALLKKIDVHKFAQFYAVVGLIPPSDIKARVERIIEEQNTDEVLTIAKESYLQVKRFYRMPWLQARLKSKRYATYIKGVNRMLPLIGPIRLRKRIEDGGKIFAFVGSDGSGKSTITNDLIRWLSYKIDCHYLYLGKQPFFKSYGKTVRSTSDLLFRSEVGRRFTLKAIGNYYFIVLIKRKISLLKRAHELKQEGSVVICDRFPQLSVKGMSDGMFLQEEGRGKLSEVERRLFLKTVEYEPDIVFKLVVSPEVASARKPEHDASQIRKKCQSIDMVTFSKSRTIEINADRPYEEVLREIQQEIWKAL